MPIGTISPISESDSSKLREDFELQFKSVEKLADLSASLLIANGELSNSVGFLKNHVEEQVKKLPDIKEPFAEVNQLLKTLPNIEDLAEEIERVTTLEKSACGEQNDLSNILKQGKRPDKIISLNDFQARFRRIKKMLESEKCLFRYDEITDYAEAYDALKKIKIIKLVELLEQKAFSLYIAMLDLYEEVPDRNGDAQLYAKLCSNVSKAIWEVQEVQDKLASDCQCNYLALKNLLQEIYSEFELMQQSAIQLNIPYRKAASRVILKEWVEKLQLQCDCFRNMVSILVPPAVPYGAELQPNTLFLLPKELIDYIFIVYLTLRDSVSGFPDVLKFLNKSSFSLYAEKLIELSVCDEKIGFSNSLKLFGYFRALKISPNTKSHIEMSDRAYTISAMHVDDINSLNSERLSRISQEMTVKKDGYFENVNNMASFPQTDKRLQTLPVSLSFKNYSGSILKGVLVDKSLSGFIYRNGQVDKVEFKGGGYRDCIELKFCDFRKSIFGNFSAHAVFLENVNFSHVVFQGDAKISLSLLKNVNFFAADLRGVEFYNLTSWSNVNLTKAVLSGAAFKTISEAFPAVGKLVDALLEAEFYGVKIELSKKHYKKEGDTFNVISRMIDGHISDAKRLSSGSLQEQKRANILRVKAEKMQQFLLFSIWMAPASFEISDEETLVASHVKSYLAFIKQYAFQSLEDIFHFSSAINNEDHILCGTNTLKDVMGILANQLLTQLNGITVLPREYLKPLKMFVDKLQEISQKFLWSRMFDKEFKKQHQQLQEKYQQYEVQDSQIARAHYRNIRN